MGKIEKNMYVRTKDGVIDKLIIDYKGTCNNPNCNCKHLSCVHNYYDEDDILKVSHNIIDLIEVGDYVNGYKIDYINLNCETPFLRSNQPYRVDNTLYSTLIEKGKNYNQPLHFYNEDIKSIVTKEQFDSMKYEVDSNE